MHVKPESANKTVLDCVSMMPRAAKLAQADAIIVIGITDNPQAGINNAAIYTMGVEMPELALVLERLLQHVKVATPRVLKSELQ